MSVQGQQFQVTIGLGKEPCGLFQRIRLKRWMEMTGKQGVFEMTERTDFGSEACL
jgi:hypothetical protein